MLTPVLSPWPRPPSEAVLSGYHVTARLNLAHINILSQLHVHALLANCTFREAITLQLSIGAGQDRECVSFLQEL